MKLRLLSALFLICPALNSLADPPAEPFNGKDLTGWELKKNDKNAGKWVVGEPAMNAAQPGALEVKPGGTSLVNAVAGHGQSVDISSKDKYGDMRLEVEVMVPKGSNSGIYVMGEYEVQVFDSYGVEKPGPGDMGALYSAAVPKTNASKKPGEWQKYIIEFRAPKFDAKGNKTSNATFVKVELNGTVIHENVKMDGPTPGGLTGKETLTGPVMFQGDHGAVAFRNLKITPLK